MPERSLADVLEATDDVVDLLRSQGRLYEENFPVVPNEETHWLDEQRAAMTSCALSDLSHHMTSVRVEGPDAVEFLNHLCANDFSDASVGRAKQALICAPNGKLWADGPVLRLDDDRFWGVVPPYVSNWIRYNDETGRRDVSVELELPTSFLDGSPEQFIYQVQGPDAMAVLEQLTDADLRDVPFYGFEEITLAGREVRAFGHGMSTEAGFEFHGPFEHATGIRGAILEAGEDVGIQPLGSKAYLSLAVRLGWIPPTPPPVYDDPELSAYREWVPADSFEGTFSISGSYDADDVSEYYMSPIELGYGKLIDFDHDFVGREALAAEIEDPERTKVTLRWTNEDVIDVFASIFREGVMEGKNAKWLDNLPRVGWAWGVYDEVRKDGGLVGLSHARSYEADVHSMISIAVVDVEYSEPGTDVTIVWGEPSGDSPNPKVEDHAQTEIRATVGPVPYSEDRRRTRSA